MKEDKNINSARFALFKNGDEEGLEFYFKAFYPALCVFANRFLTTTTIVEDIVSECFFTVWNKRNLFQDEQHLKSYLYKAVFNQCLKSKRRKIQDQLTEGIEAIVPDYSSEIIRNETLRLLYKAIDALPEQCKQVFTQLYVEGKTVRETAEEMGVAVSTVKAQKARGILLLKNKLGDIEIGMLFLLMV